MCGIVGVAGNLSAPIKKAFKQLLIIDSLRGEHSTGLLAVNSSEEKVVKRAMNALDFLQFQPAINAMAAGTRILLGHNRYATKGAINNVNAHPFEMDAIIGVHNGTLSNKQVLPDSQDFEVDSENLYHSIDKIGLEATMKLVGGSYALSWYDKETETLNFLRNDERPLHYTYTKDRRTIVWASEPEMLELILNRNNIEYSGIHSFLTEKHYEITVPINSAKPINDVSINTVEVYKEPVKKHVTNMYPSIHKKSHSGSKIEFYVGDVQTNTYNSEYLECFPIDEKYSEARVFTRAYPELLVLSNSNHLCSGIISAEFDSYVSLRPNSIEVVDEYEVEEDVKSFVGFSGELIDAKEFSKRTSCGCAWCSDHVTQDNEVHWISKDEFICESCKTMPDVRQYIIEDQTLFA